MSSILTSAPPSPSPVPFNRNTSRASSSPGSNELDQPAAQGNIELDANVKRHSEYYFKDGNVVFLIEETLYNVHRYFFERDSAHFRSILESAPGQGTDDKTPIALPGISCGDFDEFLAILYPASFRHPAQKTTAQWTSILHLAAKWGFASIQLLATDALAAAATPVDKIVLGRRYGISDWLPGAYAAVCARADPLTVEEGRKLGVEDVVRIAAARQVYGCAAAGARYEVGLLAGDLGDIFGLGEPEGEEGGKGKGGARIGRMMLSVCWRSRSWRRERNAQLFQVLRQYLAKYMRIVMETGDTVALPAVGTYSFPDPALVHSQQNRTRGYESGRIKKTRKGG